jgi:hypothetical protein
MTSLLAQQNKQELRAVIMIGICQAENARLQENSVLHHFELLYPYEFQHLLEALRRDLRASEQKAFMHPHDADYHLLNYRRTLRILEVLNPKNPRSSRLSFSH